MARKYRENQQIRGRPPSSRGEAVRALAHDRFDLVDMTDRDDVFRDEIAAHTRTYVDAGALLDA